MADERPDTMLGCEFDVHEPQELVEYLRDMGARINRATGTRPRRRNSATRRGVL